ncbi:zinc finger protein 652-A-like isoform X2 [Portunus trituberculatus]|uniref:zinc finger protein 652-A-like isoform X2 n=1 Tax=Portunus trituberculatus TaxID=210409 RepID=UPI001E1CDD3A|nr:zinc finger protein 652-A-like isoform X2 [Portunus trituberculatus]
MEDAVSPQWTLVIRNDGETSVVPLAEVSALQQDEAAIGDKNSTIIVLQTHEQDVLVDNSGLELSSSQAISQNDPVSEGEAEHVADFITVSAGQEEGVVDPLSITIADTSHHLPDIGPDTLDNIHISVLAASEVTQAIPEKAATEDSVPAPCEIQSLEPPIAAATAAPAIISSGSQRLSSIGHGADTPAFTPVYEDSRQPTKHWKEKERKEKLKNLGVKFRLGRDFTKQQRKEDFCSKVDLWTQKLACSNELVEPFERLEATLHRDITAELGLASSRNIFISLQQQGMARGVRVTETSPGHIVVSGSLMELLASRDIILEEIRKLRGLSENGTSPTTRDVGVMCELIPSPVTTRHASTLGLDRSARRYHSVLSRPLSPEPSPLRRRSKKQLVGHSSARNTDKRRLMKDFPERVTKKHAQNQNLKNVECGIKPKNKNGIFSECIHQNSQEEDPHNSLSMSGVKTEPCAVQTISISNQSSAESERVKNEDSSDLKALGMSQDGSSLAVSAVREGDGTKPPERTVHTELNKADSCLENINNDCCNVNKSRQQVDEVDMTMKDEVFDQQETFKETEELQDPQNSNQVKFKFSCKICSYKSTRENHFIKHMQLHEKGLALYRCSECNFVSIRASHLRRHKMSHALQVLHCHLCAYTCDDQKLLTKHVRVKHHTPKQPSPSDNMFECEECEYKTSWHYAFQKHQRTHTSSKVVVMHSCPQCHYKTVRREHFLRHIKNVHQNYRPFLCDICGKAFKRQDALKQHHVSHYQNLAQVGPYGFVCHICQKVCRSAAYLKEHMATHSEERSFLCEVCGASFKTRSVQRNHVQTIHRRPRAFTCVTCDKKFNTKFALRRHMKQHGSSIQDIEELQDLARNSRVNSSVGRLCELQPAASSLLPQGSTSMVHLPGRSRSSLPSAPESPPQHPSSACQITIDGQPPFLVPHLDSQHAALESGEACISKGSGTSLVGGEGSSGAELAALGNTQAGATVSMPVVPATVHILNQNTLSTSSGDLILSSEHYDGSQGSAVVGDDTTNYINADHGNSTLLYLTANFN